MKYAIIIVATGTHHQGHLTGNLEKDGDYLAKETVTRLQKAGHAVAAAVFIPDGGAEELLAGDLKALEDMHGPGGKAAWAGAAQLPEESLAELLELTRTNGATLATLLQEVRGYVSYEKADDAPKPRVSPPEKKKGRGEKTVLVSNQGHVVGSTSKEKKEGAAAKWEEGVWN